MNACVYMSTEEKKGEKEINFQEKWERDIFQPLLQHIPCSSRHRRYHQTLIPPQQSKNV